MCQHECSTACLPWCSGMGALCNRWQNRYSYTETTTTVLDLDAPRDNPNAVSFTLNNVKDKFTFTNTGEQQCVIVYIEYHFGGADGIDTVASNETPLRVEYYTLSGQRIAAPEKGICIMRTIMQDGRSISRKIVKDLTQIGR